MLLQVIYVFRLRDGLFTLDLLRLTFTFRVSKGSFPRWREYSLFVLLIFYFFPCLSAKRSKKNSLKEKTHPPTLVVETSPYKQQIGKVVASSKIEMAFKKFYYVFEV